MYLPVCFTCGTPIGHLVTEYLELCESLRVDAGYTDKILVANTTRAFAPQLAEFLDAHGVTNLCCRARFLGYSDTLIPYGGTYDTEGIDNYNADILEDLVTTTEL